MTAAMAAGAAGADLVRALAAQRPPPPPPPTPPPMPQAVATAAATAGLSHESGDWQSAGARIRFDRSVVLGTGSRNAVVFAGEFMSERAGKAAAPAAVKRLPRPRGGGGGDELLALVQREVELLRLLNARSTRIASLYGYHEDMDWVYIAYERCERSLAQALDAALPPPAQRLVLLAGVAGALAELHGLGYAHNDVHSGNVLLTADGDVKLTDVQFAVRTRGEAQRFSMSSVAALDVRLNMARRAPEVISGGKLTTKVDVWALGVLAYQLLTGKPSPFATGRAKQGSGGSGAGFGGSGGGGLMSEVEENRRIRLGEFDLTLLDAPALQLPRRAAAEARHLLGACLAVRPEARPSAAEVCEHPLFWSATHALGPPLRTLRAREPEEAALRRAMESAGLRDAYARLANWKATAHAPLLAAHARAKPPTGYSEGLAQLLRFARNCVEHPPLPGTLPPPPLGGTAAASAAASTEARRDAVVAHLLERWPELPLALHVGLAATPAGAAQQAGA
jgi:serine/threonine protein kinase